MVTKTGVPRSGSSEPGRDAFQSKRFCAIAAT